MSPEDIVLRYIGYIFSALSAIIIVWYYSFQKGRE